jgi:hypothetical protein
MAKAPKQPVERGTVYRIRDAVKALKRMPIEDRIQLMVKADLMSQNEADQAKQRVAAAGQQSAPRDVPH